MNNTKLALALTGAMILAGCVYIPLGKVPQLTAGNLAAAGKVSLSVQPQITSGGFSTQELVELYTKANVNHLLLTLSKVDGASESLMVDATGTPITKDVLAAGLDAPVTFTNLHPNATYRIHAFAFQATGTASVDVISEDASSSLDIRVLTDEKPVASDFPIKLKDRPFHGEATSSFTFTPGTYLTDPEGIR